MNIEKNILLYDLSKSDHKKVVRGLSSQDYNLLVAHNEIEAIQKLTDYVIPIIIVNDYKEAKSFLLKNIVKKSKPSKVIAFIDDIASEIAEEILFYDQIDIDSPTLATTFEFYLRIIDEYEKVLNKVYEKEAYIHNIKEQQTTLKLKNEQLQLTSNLDGLTMIPNRVYFDKTFELEWNRLLRNKDYISIMMLDIDHFKIYNDTYGHLKGDECLKRVAKVIEQSFNRASDFIARYGGEEFVILLSHVDYEETQFLANRLLKNIQNAKILNENSKVSQYLTVSIGAVNLIPSSKYNKMSVLREADNALYYAKVSGRNQVKMIQL